MVTDINCYSIYGKQFDILSTVEFLHTKDLCTPRSVYTRNAAPNSQQTANKDTCCSSSAPGSNTSSLHKKIVDQKIELQSEKGNTVIANDMK